MRNLEILLLAAVLNVLLFGWYFAHSHPEYFRDVYVREDGVVEYATAVCLLAGALVWLYRSFHLRAVRPRLFLGMTGLLGLLFLFGLGEELSWGQRIFAVESPEFFATHNAQRETNLHNLVVGGVKINKLIFGRGLALAIVTYLVAFPLLYRKSARARALMDRCAVPVPAARHVWCYVALFVLVSLVPSSRRGELLEFGGCSLFLLIALYPHNRETFRRSPQRPAQA